MVLFLARRAKKAQPREEWYGTDGREERIDVSCNDVARRSKSVSILGSRGRVLCF